MNESLQSSSTSDGMTASVQQLVRQRISSADEESIEQQNGTINVTGQQPWSSVQSVPVKDLISQGDLKKAQGHLVTVTFKVPKEFAVNGHNFCELEVLGQTDGSFRSGTGQLLVPEGTTMVRNTEQALVGREIVVGG